MGSVSRYFWAGIFLALLITPSVQAGGLYLYELGTPDMGAAAAGWSARAQDAATVFTNPAGMTRLKNSELLVGVQPLYLHAQFSPDADTTTSGSDGDASAWLPAGGLYYVHNLMPKLKIGVSAVGYFGLGLEYENDWVGRYYVQEIKLQAVGIQPAVAYRVTDWLSLGVGVVALYGVLEEKAAVKNIGPNRPDGRLKIEDSDWTYQVNLGVLTEPRKGTRFGLTYLSEGDLEFKDQPDFGNLGPGLETALRAKGLLDADIKVEFTMPQAIMFSAYQELTDHLALMGNLGWQDWSEFGQVGVAVTSEDTSSLTIDRNYKDTWHVAVGAQYRVAEPWLLTAGVAYDSSMVDDEDRTPDLPLGEMWRFGLGARCDWSKKLALGVGYTFLWSGDLDMDVNRGPLAGRVSGTYENTSMNFINFYLNWKF
ncbi:MAG: outer membrane protein transport protein [Desulfobacterales bacterium]